LESRRWNFTKPDQPSDTERLTNYRPTSSTAWLGPAINSSYSPINLYEPRPSTAPVMESQGLSYMLPAKRDLPFAQTLSRSGPSASRTTKDMTKFGLPALPLENRNGLQPSSSLPSPAQEFETQSETPTAKKKRAPAQKTPTRAPKKSAAPRSRKKAASHRDAGPVPSVEELLRGSQQSPKMSLQLLRLSTPRRCWRKSKNAKLLPLQEDWLTSTN
jgi:hypothetical protein